ncbi:MAG: 3-isopropylmalate dehydratase small subunit [Myxococcales bacterium]|nr:3-isopropylmalate dehydratase small subunit [Myxococcales bacterium]
MRREPFRTLRSHAIALSAEDVDTDQIIPARFLKTTIRAGLGQHLFQDWRYEDDGSPKAEFVLNRPASAGAKILVAGQNFGCGSSREHAPWALLDWGLQAIIAPSFADIFRGNALKNGVLPIVLEEALHSRLLEAVSEDPGAILEVDLEAQQVRLPGGERASFAIDAFSKHCLLEGIDELDYLLACEEAIAAHERANG